MEPLVSVIIAAYRPGDAFQRVMDSLDAQTLPQERFETIVVDDGSGDDTFERLTAFAATRPNMRVEQIENSGWPSRPRNVGTDLARGEYVLFMDHDDSLFPDGLRAAVEFAKANRSDVVSPKESRTNDVWWSMHPLMHGNVGNVLPGGDIDLLRPMVPHKLYRRAFLDEHGIRFPEGRRVLWEDNYQNVAVYRHAQVISLLADTPVYLWHASATNNSRTYGPMSTEFWDRLDDLTAAIDRTLDAPEYAAARKSALLHEHRWRLLHRLMKSTVGNPDGPKMDRAYERANRIQERYIPTAWDADLGVFDRVRATLVRARRADLVRLEHDAMQAVSLQVEASEVRWDGGVLRFHVAARLLDGDRPIAFRAVGDRLLRVVRPEIADVVPAALLDVTDEVERLELEIAVRSRDEPVTWPVPAVMTVRRESQPDGAVGMVAEGEAELALSTAEFGRPLASGVWDVSVHTRWGGLGRSAAPTSVGSVAVLAGDRGAIAYSTQKGRLAIDTAQRLRTVLREGRLPIGADLGRGDRPFSLPLPRLVVADATGFPLELIATAQDGTTSSFAARVVAGADGGRLESVIRLGPGVYGLRARMQDQVESVAVPRRIVVKRDGRMTLDRPLSAVVSTAVGPRVVSLARSVARRALRRARALRRR